MCLGFYKHHTRKIMQEPFIHLFKANYKKYVYDVNTKVVLLVSDNVYQYLDKDNEEVLTEEDIKYLNDIKAEGFLSSKRIERTEHAATSLLPFYLKTNMNHLILQLTQNCNMRCDYCVYSGGYKTRKHNNKTMSFSTAKKGIDYLLEHSRDSKTLNLGFYGGEPLLEFKLIQKCITYLESKIEDKEIWYIITTNATLMTPEVIDYMASHNFNVSLSIDGPKSLHDENRKYAGSDASTFDIIMKNIQYAKEKYPEFFKTRIMISTVLDTERGFSKINKFFKEFDIIQGIANVRSSTISPDYALKEHSVNERYKEEVGYERFKLYLSVLNRLNKKHISPLLKVDISEFSRLDLGTMQKHRNSIGEVGHHGGPCIPGGHRLFMNVEGCLFPCEKVCELSEDTKIGNINTGIELEKVENIINIEKICEDKCHNCWAYDFCTVCIRLADDNKSHLKKLIEQQCENIKLNLEENLKDYCFLKEYGYNFDIMQYERGIEK